MSTVKSRVLSSKSSVNTEHRKCLLGLVAILVATPVTVTVPKLDPNTDETLPLSSTAASEL